VHFLAAWVLFPAILVVGSLGWGTVIARLAGLRLPGVLLFPLGMAGMIAASRLVTSSVRVGHLAPAVLVVMALVGLALAVPRLRGARLDRFAAIAAIGVFCVAASPVALSGKATFAGYNLLPDIAYQMSLGELYANHGPDWEPMQLSSYREQTRKYIVSAYPVGAQVTVGSLARVAPGDVWQLYQPFVSFQLAMLSLSLYGLLSPWVRSRLARGAAAFVAAQPALTVAFALQGSIKEVSVVAQLALLAALVAGFIAERWSPRALLALAVPVGASFATLGPAAGAYLAPMLAVLVVVWLRRLRAAPTRSAIAATVGAGAVGLALVAPVLRHLRTAYDINTATLVGGGQDLGNLARPLKPAQVAGIWLNGDYRFSPAAHHYLSVMLIGIALLAAVLGAIWILRRRAIGPLMLAGPLGLTSVYLASRGSPYADAKVLAVASPVAVLLALLGALFLVDAGRRIEGVLLGAIVGGGVLVSNALAYHDAQLAPYDRYAELSRIDSRLDGKGPAILSEYDEFGAYFLRHAPGLSQPEWAHQYRGNFADLQRRPTEKAPLDPDMFTLRYIESKPAIVLRRSPTASRPPANFTRTFAGRYYDVWQPRPGSRGTVREHLPLGTNLFRAGDVPRCGQVVAMGRRAQAIGGRLAYVERPLLPFALPLQMVVKIAPSVPTPGVERLIKRGAVPSKWFQYANYPGALVDPGQGRVRATYQLPGGRYRLWLEGSFGRRVSVQVDGRQVGSVSYEAGNAGQYRPLGWVALSPGRHEVAIYQGGGDLHPANGGSEGSLRHVGPLAFSPPQNEERAVRTMVPARARSLCGRSLDWIEVVR
jgi:hypothetical protein